MASLSWFICFPNYTMALFIFIMISRLRLAIVFMTKCNELLVDLFYWIHFFTVAIAGKCPTGILKPCSSHLATPLLASRARLTNNVRLSHDIIEWFYPMAWLHGFLYKVSIWKNWMVIILWWNLLASLSKSFHGPE